MIDMLREDDNKKNCGHDFLNKKRTQNILKCKTFILQRFSLFRIFTKSYVLDDSESIEKYFLFSFVSADNLSFYILGSPYFAVNHCLHLLYD